MKLELPRSQPEWIDQELFERKLITAEMQESEVSAPAEPADAGIEVVAAAGGPRGLPIIDWAAAGVAHLAPQAVPFPPGNPRDFDPLPKADVVVVTWTSAEWDALHYVFTNALSPLPQSPGANDVWRAEWRPYRRNFHRVRQALWTHRLIGAARNRAAAAPSLSEGTRGSWGSYAMCTVGGRSVLLIKSALHINQDGESLPLEMMTRQILGESRPDLLLSTGTSGGVRVQDGLGDTVVSNSARFRLSDEFGTADFNDTSYTCKTWTPPNQYLAAAESLLIDVAEDVVEPPTLHYPAGVILRPKPHKARILLLPDNPILTTDLFEYGTTMNGLGDIGCCVEMDDAVFAKVCEEHGPQTKYGFVRNLSDPVINGDMPRDLQVAWATATYYRKGLHTSFNSAIATWAMIAGS